MGFFGFAKVCLYSEVSGVVTLHGKPVAGAEIIRKVWWPDEKLHTDNTTTDAQGQFHFAPMFAFSLLRQYMPIEPVIEQTMFIRFQGKEYPAWSGAKHGYDLNDEFNHRKLPPITCELNLEPAMKDDPSLFMPVKTICKW